MLLFVFLTFLLSPSFAPVFSSAGEEPGRKPVQAPFRSLFHSQLCRSPGWAIRRRNGEPRPGPHCYSHRLPPCKVSGCCERQRSRRAFCIPICPLSSRRSLPWTPPNTCNAPPPCRTQLTHDSRTRGPEIELCIADEGSDPALDNDWSLLPFMALSDGAHTYEPSRPPESLP